MTSTVTGVPLPGRLQANRDGAFLALGEGRYEGGGGLFRVQPGHAVDAGIVIAGLAGPDDEGRGKLVTVEPQFLVGAVLEGHGEAVGAVAMGLGTADGDPQAVLVPGGRAGAERLGRTAREAGLLHLTVAVEILLELRDRSRSQHDQYEEGDHGNRAAVEPPRAVGGWCVRG
ncbi:hypothetical protein [Streptomyces sp. b84]|uniref:hypothetical protein n=1 Tax=Streptomyces sp. b84 TaxID=1827631 RepID=UPI0015CEFB3E|nr:hypothetical protein [Streptomyces sp. b84]